MIRSVSSKRDLGFEISSSIESKSFLPSSVGATTGELVSAPAILALYDDGAQALAESAIGRVRAPGGPHYRDLKRLVATT